METQNQTQNLPESILIEILARLPLRSISRFKSVCKTWKSTLEYVYFRRLFVSVHQKSSSSSWSLMFKGSELLNFHGCKTWGLPKSLASYNDLPLNTNRTKLSFSNGLVSIEEDYDDDHIFVGNPVLKQWFQIPPTPQWFRNPPTPYESKSRNLATRFGFVTRVDENGVVLDFKVIRSGGRITEFKEGVKAYFDLLIYSSETGRWTSKKICSLHYEIDNSACPVMNLNGTLYLSSKFSYGPPDHEGILLAHDFFSDSDQCRVIRLPDYDLNYKWDSKRALTTSLGSVIYIKVLVDQKGDNLLNIWRLNNDDDCWQLLSEILVSFDASDYAPLAMHPFDGNIVYLWSQEKRHLVSCNLRTQNYKVLGDESTQHNDNDDHQDCFVNQSLCENYMNENSQRSSISEYRAAIQFTLPRWMESMPRPPQVEEEMDPVLSRTITLERDRRQQRRF